MRALLLAALLAAPAAAVNVLPDGWKAQSVDQWGGLNLLNDSSSIGADAQQAQNVLTDSGYLEKRPGNVLLTTILPGYPVQYVNDWVSPSGTRYLITQSSQNVYQTNFAGTSVAISTTAAGYNLTTAPGFSKLNFADGFRPLWYWNGITTGTVSDASSGAAAPICTYIDFKDSRMWCANIPNESSSRVRLSSAGGNGYYVVPTNANQVDTAPNFFDLSPDDGDSITCMARTPWGEFVSKRYSSFIIKGSGSLSYDPRILDPKIGCVDNRSVQMVYGVLKWQAIDGVYGYDGSGPPHLLTRELDPLMRLARSSTYSEGSWSTQLLPDWSGGTQSPTTGGLPVVPWDYSALPGEIFPSSFTLYDDNRSPQFQGGVGFSSDTLVNIDTTTYPLSVGVAQMLPSANGIQVWQSTFQANAAYMTIPTTWTRLSGSFAFENHGGGGVRGDSGGMNQFYTMAASQYSPPENGWNFGTWSLGWYPYDSGANKWGDCGNLDECFEFDFIADKITKAGSAETLWNGYGIQVDESTCPAGVCAYNMTLFRSVLGNHTTLGSKNFNLPQTGTFGGYSTFTITMTGAGRIDVSMNGSPLISAVDNSISPRTSVLNFITLVRSGAVTYNVIGDVSLSGFNTGSITSRIYDTGMSVPVAGALSSSYTLQGLPGETEIDFYLRSSTSPNNDMWTAWQASSNNVVAALPNRYWQHQEQFYTHVASYTPVLASVQLLGITTGYYYSQVDYIGAGITSWKQFAVSETNPGTYGYAVRSATYSFSPSATSPSWVAQTANQNVNLSVSTPTYAQFRLDSTAITNATVAEPISAVFLRWALGANIPVASATLDRRYMLCVTVSLAATAPDTCLLQQKNGKWVQWKGPSVGAMGSYNYNMVAADGGTSSKVWEIMQPGVYSDDGTPIDANWVTEDFTDGVVFNNKVLHEMWVDALPVQYSSVTVSYQVDKSSGWNDYKFGLDNGQALNPTSIYGPITSVQYGSINKFVPLQSGYSTGKYIRLKFEDNTLGSYFRINSALMYVEDLGRMMP